jgi:hypothetical protein
VVCELKAPHEAPGRNALIENVRLGLFVAWLFLAADRQGVLLRLNGKIGLGEPGDSDRDAKGVFARPLDVIGRVARRRSFDTLCLIEQREHAVESNG